MPSINRNPKVMVIGDDSQRSIYRPYLMRWTGAGWRLARYGPMVTGRTSMQYDTWDRSGGPWTVPVTVDPAPRSH
jgi:hypothetical protein